MILVKSNTAVEGTFFLVEVREEVETREWVGYAKFQVLGKTRAR